MPPAATVRRPMSRTERAGGDCREALVARWLELTRVVLPGMAAERRWPIRLDHCFMRVCLDDVLGAPWTDSIGRPAIRCMSEAQLAAAVAVAEGVAADPERLRPLNEASLRGRRSARAALSRRCRAGVACSP